MSHVVWIMTWPCSRRSRSPFDWAMSPVTKVQRETSDSRYRTRITGSWPHKGCNGSDAASVEPMYTMRGMRVVPLCCKQFAAIRLVVARL